MRTILFIFAILVVSLVAFVVCDELGDTEKLCLKEVNVTENELNAFFKGGMKPADAKDNVKCFIKCIMENEGHLKNGAFLEEATIKALKTSPAMKDFPNLEKIVSECKNEKGPTDCDTAFKIMMCLFKNNVKLD